MAVKRVALLFLIFGSLNSAQSQTCYQPDGITVDSGATPCNQNGTGFSHCCGVGNLCLDNGYCIGLGAYGMKLSRDSCTDKTFTSPNCPSYCKEALPNGGINMFAVTDNSTSSYCCGPPGPDFNTTLLQCALESANGSMHAFQVPNGNIIYNRTSGSTAPNATVVDTIVTVTAQSDSTSQQPSSGHDVAIGAGVGIPLGMLLLGSLALLWVRERKWSRRTKELQSYTPVRAGSGEAWFEHGGGKPPLLRRNIHEMDAQRPDELEGTPIAVSRSRSRFLELEEDSTRKVPY